MKKSHLLFLGLLGSFTLNARLDIQKQMLDTFVKYASIDSRS